MPRLIEIQKTFDFDAAHRLDRLPPDHKCHRLHGHTYRVEIRVRGEIDEQTGMLVDYERISKAWAPLHDRLDHHYLNDVDGLEVPTTEVLAWWIFNRLALFGKCAVRVYESSSTWAEARA